MLSYVGIIIFGALLLMLPWMHNGHLSFLQSLFTSTSAFTCTGLIIKDTSSDFTFWGQLVILTLIQVGGFGYMTLLGLFYVFLHKKISNREKNLIRESMNYPSHYGIVRFIKKVVVFVVLIEGMGALILSGYFYFVKDFGFLEGVWAGIFHSISAFNNAGFSIFHTNLMEFQASIVINVVVSVLIISGGLGYLVLIELFQFIDACRRSFFLSGSQDPRSKRLSLHGKIVLSYTVFLLLCGLAMILLIEWNNVKSIGSFGIFDKILSSFFMSVNYRTSGFNTIDLSGLSDPSLFLASILMNVGGAPGGTAGGIKITTLAILLAFCIALFSDRPVRIFKRGVAESSVKKAIAMFIVASLSLIFSIFLILVFETNVRFIHILFEVSSAFATVGVSVGNGGILSLSANFSQSSQIVIMFLMLMGKMGVLTLWFAFKWRSKKTRIQLQEERIII